MKALCLLFLLTGMSGCAENTPPAEEVREHFERGLSGQGHLVPLDQPDQPIARPESAAPAPR
ncbi:MAG TPA: hypothetical protein VGF73_10640 [Chthoniobacterales bacterium]|jgi:hypothetical protein